MYKLTLLLAAFAAQISTQSLASSDEQVRRILKELEQSAATLSSPSSETSSIPSINKKTQIKKEGAAVNVEGSTIVGDLNASPDAKALASKVTEIQQMTYEFRAKVLKFQDELSRQVNESSQIHLNLQSPTSEIKNRGFREIETTLNDVPLMHLRKPLVLEKNSSIPLYSGPLPLGDYELKIRAVIGTLEHNWPYAVSQGTLVVENVIKFSVATKGQIINKTIVLKNSDGISEFTLKSEH